MAKAKAKPYPPTLLELMARVTGRSVGGLHEDASLDADLGLSSLDRLELLSTLEDRYQVDLSEARFGAVRDAGWGNRPALLRTLRPVGTARSLASGGCVGRRQSAPVSLLRRMPHLP